MNTKKKNNPRLPRKFSPLFWDVSLKDIDLEANASYVMERILEFGTWESVVWLREFYGDDAIKNYILKRGYKVLSPKTLNYWKNTLPINARQWQKLSLLRTSKKLWR